jgi:hypothetical protein
VRWRLGELRKEWHETGEWLAQDPDVVEIEPAGGKFVVTRLFKTSVGDIAFDGGAGGARVTKFDEAGWARTQAWTRRHGVEALAAGLTAAGLPEVEALRIAEEMEPLVESRRFHSEPRSWYRRQGIKFGALYAAPWGVGVAWMVAKLTH